MLRVGTRNAKTSSRLNATAANAAPGSKLPAGHGNGLMSASRAAGCAASRSVARPMIALRTHSRLLSVAKTILDSAESSYCMSGPTLPNSKHTVLTHLIFSTYIPTLVRTRFPSSCLLNSARRFLTPGVIAWIRTCPQCFADLHVRDQAHEGRIVQHHLSRWNCRLANSQYSLY